jgi:hypothetical protein
MELFCWLRVAAVALLCLNSCLVSGEACLATCDGVGGDGDDRC